MPLGAEWVSAASELEEKVFSKEAWSAKAIAETISHNGRYFAAFSNDVYVGHGGFTFAADEGYVTNIVVGENARRQGVASKILEEMLLSAKDLGLAFLSLEVRESNLSAIKLYEKNGFTLRGKRPKFYSEPIETALIFTKDI